MASDERIGIILQGAGFHSKRSYCKSCNQAILDLSRTRPKMRCEACSRVHLQKIKKISAERFKAERLRIIEGKKKEDNS